jgi:uncharacterized protein YjaZ
VSTHISEVITYNKKELIVTAVSLSGSVVPDSILSIVGIAFKKLSPYIKDDRQVIYIRDIPSLSINVKYPGGHCFNRHEAMIALPKWNVEKQQLIATINHELHHMARWQNAGYGNSLGGAILSEGIATYYEELQSGWSPPWAKAKFTTLNLSDVLDNWNNEHYDHRSWFIGSDKGRWVGYAIGYRLAKELYKNGFNLRESLLIKSDEVNIIAAKLLN